MFPKDDNSFCLYKNRRTPQNVMTINPTIVRDRVLPITMDPISKGRSQFLSSIKLSFLGTACLFMLQAPFCLEVIKP